uniref:NADH-ubiquinone oxidoreductase chain 5 n=1 Tax=Aleyrodes shizuokensis TaxID=860392 RepID=A0A7T1K7N9_9HEMI|nr:NADH dehydrogenase subunit 5 [Aleyrodes shizuokensis]QPO06178.1 NADH dehydrogenase subunit 5 [Aleyrodes shizuokensis]
MLNKYYLIKISVMSVIMMLMFFMTISKSMKLMIEWNMMKIMSLNLNFSILMDSKSVIFAATVMLITASIMLYSKFYMMTTKKENKFFKLIMIFILSMLMLIFSPSMISLILGWEGLGMTSFILIMFYQNKKTLASSFLTMMMNRLGDIMLIMSMAIMINLNSWMITCQMFKMYKMIMILICIAAFSKSAQIPFSSWLTEAMAAPTPISALVHSSTLVTAGIFLIIRFEQTMKYTNLNFYMMLMSMMTLIMASMNSITEWDLKKIVALSTLSQLSMMFISISIHMYSLAMFHMIMHAMFKALIFLCSSTIITYSNTQDMRKMTSMIKSSIINNVSMMVATLTLSGFPFLSSFYSKELIMEMMMIKKMNWMLILSFYACMMCTLFYSMKMILFTTIMKKNMSMTTINETQEQQISKMMLLIPSIMAGNKLNWIINLNFKLPHMKFINKIIPVMMMMYMLIMIYSIYSKSINMMYNKNSIKIMMNNSMWFMKIMTTPMKKKLLANYMMIFKSTEIKLLILSTDMIMKLKNMTKINYTIIMKDFIKIIIIMLIILMIIL